MGELLASGWLAAFAALRASGSPLQQGMRERGVASQPLLPSFATVPRRPD
jgi:hypothetical protein